MGFHRVAHSHPGAYGVSPEQSMSGFSDLAPEFWKEVPNVLDAENCFGRLMVIQGCV